MVNIAKISEMLRSLIFFHTIADIFTLNFEEPVLRAQLEFEFNSFSTDMFSFQSFFIILVSGVHPTCSVLKISVEECKNTAKTLTFLKYR